MNRKDTLKSLFVILFFCCSILKSYAVPVDPTPLKVYQPDGRELILKGYGDEFFHCLKTLDGYPVVKDKNNYYTYAVNDQSFNLVSSGCIARNVSERTVQDLLFLKENNIQMELRAPKTASKAIRALPKLALPHKAVASSSFKGLVVLVQFQDVKFSIADASTVFNNQLNQPGYNLNDATGSVKDYFQSCSMGNFVPNLTLAGPVTLSQNMAYYGADKEAKAQEMVIEACQALDGQINFADYDLDKDGKVDMIYIIYAGHSESENSDMPDFIWPHASSVWKSSVVLDGTQISRYACSSELGGRYTTKVIAGIGTLCHEFSHVLGLPDMYDVDYEGSGGQSLDPGKWSIMAGGSYLNASRTPPSYSAYERTSVGWLNPVLISTGGQYSLSAINETNKAYYFNAKSPNETFYIENRQNIGWDKYLPGHGMLIFRVDMTNPDIWANNDVNANPLHQYYDLLRADNASTNGGGNSFPGIFNVREISDFTTPSLKSYAGTPSDKTISDITELANGDIEFNVVQQEYEQIVEDFEPVVKDSWTSEMKQGTIGGWTFSNASTTQTSTAGVGNGRMVAAVKNGKIEMTFDVNQKIKSVNLIASLASSVVGTSKTIRVEYSIDKGANWIALGSDILLNSSLMTSYSIKKDLNTPVRFRVIGIATSIAYIDDFSIIYESPITGISRVKMPLTYYLKDNIVYLMNDGLGKQIEVYNSLGQKVLEQKMIEGWNEICIQNSGIYIIKANGVAIKIIK